MKSFGAGFAAHLASGATTLATCWRIERSDGLVLGFTDHDLVLRFEDTDFVPAHGLDGGATVAKLGAQVDTSEVLGVIHADAIRADDIALGRFDGASVATWRVNWRDVSQRALLRRDTIGEIVQEDGAFRAELRSIAYALNVPKGRIYQALCDAQLGDARCGVDLEQPQFKATGSVRAVEGRNRVAVEGLESFPPDWFGFGTARWTSGRRSGLEDAVLGHVRLGETDVLSFDAPVGEWVGPGDAMTLLAGCDRRFATCKAKFGNRLNFRGFPHVPGADLVLRYPRAGEARDGRPLVR